MTWLERIENKVLEIETGDGKIYKPLWQNASREFEFHVDGFDFVGIDGTYVERKNRRGGQYPILLYFQGEDNIDQTNAFLESTLNQNPWTVRHPLYDDIQVQPISLKLNDSSYNATVVTGVIWETISTKFPLETRNITKNVIVIKTELDAIVIGVFTNDIGTPSSAAVELSTNSVNSTFDNYQDVEDSETLRGLQRKASGAASNIVAAPTEYITEAQNLINFPFLAEQSLTIKINKVIDSIRNLFPILIEDNETLENQILYEANVTTLLTEVCVVSISPESTDYQTRAEVLEAVNSIDEIYLEYITNLDDVDYNPNPELSFGLDNVINQTLANLFQIAFSAKQERSTILNTDSNIVVEANKYFGPGDDNLNDFIAKNNISLTDYLQLEKGREIIYYV